MRQLKFRIWWPDTKTYSKHFELKELLLNSDGYDLDSSCILEQFTGLKDKNGVDVYEGDIVLRDDKNGEWIMRWEPKCAGFISEWGDDWKWIKADYQPLYEVIGNIHETPELLAKKENS